MALYWSFRSRPSMPAGRDGSKPTSGAPPGRYRAYFFSLLLEQTPRVALFAPELFYPYRWDEPHRRRERFPNAYAIHHWAGTLPLPADGDLETAHTPPAG